MTDFLAVDIDGGSGMRAFEKKRHTLFPPVTRYIDTFPTPSLAHEFATAFPVRLERARQHHIVVVMRRVVEGEIPGAIQAEDVLGGDSDN